MKIFSGGSNPLLASKIAGHLKVELGKIFLHSFPSGESYCQYKENLRGEDVFLIQSTSYPTNENLMQLLVMVDAAKRASASRITAVIPYFGYARQDRKDKPRVPISAKMVMNLLEAAGVNRILTMDLHVAQIQGMTDLPFDHISSENTFIKHINSYAWPRNGIILSPDAGGIKRAESFAEKIGIDFGFIVKDRKGDTEVKANKIIGNIEGKWVFIVDDVTESCGTIIEATKLCWQNGCIGVTGYIAHGALTDVGYERLENYDNHRMGKLHSTNSIQTHETGRYQQIDVSDLFAASIHAIHTNQSISKILENIDYTLGLPSTK